jgi:hypothetical protein
MSVPELIEDVLRRIRSTDRYHGRDREFLRDRTALTKAIARYGYACNERGWHFQPNEILGDLVALLRDIVNKNAPIGYFPVYLEGAVDRHIRTRAEELNERARKSKLPAALVPKIVSGTQVVRVIEPTSVELLDAIYRDLKARRKAARQVKPARTRAAQGELTL